METRSLRWQRRVKFEAPQTEPERESTLEATVTAPERKAVRNRR